MTFTIEHLSKQFEEKVVLKDINITIEEGKIYGLLGRNGAGKTTLFNCLNRDMKVNGGVFFLSKMAFAARWQRRMWAMYYPRQRYRSF